MKMFVLAHITPPYIFTPLNHHSVTLPCIHIQKTPQTPKTPSEKYREKPPNPEMEPIRIAKGPSKNIAPRNLPKSRKPPKKVIKKISSYRFQKAIPR
jgi:hypothetical protein